VVIAGAIRRRRNRVANRAVAGEIVEVGVVAVEAAGAAEPQSNM
jgi:hypothetical protein